MLFFLIFVSCLQIIKVQNISLQACLRVISPWPSVNIWPFYSSQKKHDFIS